MSISIEDMVHRTKGASKTVRIRKCGVILGIIDVLGKHAITYTDGQSSARHHKSYNAALHYLISHAKDKEKQT